MFATRMDKMLSVPSYICCSVMAILSTSHCLSNSKMDVVVTSLKAI